MYQAQLTEAKEELSELTVHLNYHMGELTKLQLQQTRLAQLIEGLELIIASQPDPTPEPTPLPTPIDDTQNEQIAYLIEEINKLKQGSVFADTGTITPTYTAIRNNGSFMRAYGAS